MVRLGINIHPVYPVAPAKPSGAWSTRAYSAEEKRELDRFLVESNADANLVMNDINEARRIAGLTPKSDTIFRLYNKDIEGALWTAHTPDTYVEGMTGYFDDRLILNLGNEPNGKMPLDELKRVVEFYCGVMERLHKAGQRATLPAWGSGNPKLEYFTDDESWSVIKPLFEAFRDYPTNSLNLHSYFNKYGLGYGSGHVGRHETIAGHLLERLGFIPNMYISEYGADLVADEPGPWQEVFTFDDLGETRYAEILLLGPVKAFGQSYVKGLIVFCWGAYPLWRLYDISKARIVKAAIIKFNTKQTTKPVVHWISTIASVTAIEAVLMRSAPAQIDGNGLASIKNGMMIEYEGEAVNGWWHVRYGGIEGYLPAKFFSPGVRQLPAENTEPPIGLPPKPKPTEPPPVELPPKPEPKPEQPKPPIQTFTIPVTMTIQAENEEVATLVARYMAVTMESHYRQFRYDAELLKRIDEVKSVQFSIEFKEGVKV